MRIILEGKKSPALNICTQTPLRFLKSRYPTTPAPWSPRAAPPAAAAALPSAEVPHQVESHQVLIYL